MGSGEDDDDEVGDDSLAASTKPVAAPGVAPIAGALDRVIDGRYRIVAERGRGGMSVVHEIEDTPLARRLALKQPLTDDPSVALRILREAAILSCLDHPNILAVYTSGRLAGGAPYFITRLVEGESLEARARRDPAGWPALLATVADVADAVAHAHARGVVHRDLKPENVLLDARGGTVVVDWGVARELPERAGAPGLAGVAITESGTPVGTPGYWSPEQRAGAIPDPRADVYSIGAIVARLVSGRPPSDDGPRADDLAGAPRALRALVERAIARDPRERLSSAAELAAALRSSGRRRPRWLLAAIPVVVLVAAATAWLVTRLLPH